MGGGSAEDLPAPAALQQSPAAPALLRLKLRLLFDTRAEVVRHNRVEDVLPVAGVRLLSGDQLPHGDPKGKDICFGRHRLTFQQLRRPVRVRAAHVTHPRTAVAGLTPTIYFQRATEVRNFAEVFTGYQDVGWFYVQMDDVVRVKEAQTVSNVRGVPEPPVRLQRLHAFIDELLQISAPHELHQYHPDAVSVFKLFRNAGGGRNDAHDVFVAQVRGVQLGPEALPGRQRVFGLFFHFFQGYSFSKIFCLVDRTEPSRTHRLNRAQLLPVDHRRPKPGAGFAMEALSRDLKSRSTGGFSQWAAADADIQRRIDVFGKEASHRDRRRHGARRRALPGD